MQYMPDMPARTGRFLYTTRQQYETMTSTTFKTHDMKEEEHAPGTGECHVMSCDVMQWVLIM